MKRFMRPMVILMAMAIVGGTILTGCNNKETNKAKTNIEQKQEKLVSEKEEKFINEKFLVEADWLKDNLNNEKVLILDARGEKAYNKAHIPGSLSIAWQQLSNMEGKSSDEGWGNILEAEQLSKKLSEIGISDDKTVVVYCDTRNGWGDDGRITWMLSAAGVKNVKMLNGGIQYWTEKQYETTNEASTPNVSDFKVEKLDTAMNITTEELKNKLGKVVILDSRAEDEYNGATKYGETRGGHIPGAKNLPFNNLFKEDGTYKNPSEIKKMLDELGINKDDEIVTYCTAGIRSAHLAISLKMMGYENVKNYDSSFYAWSANQELEVEK